LVAAGLTVEGLVARLWGLFGPGPEELLVRLELEPELVLY
jgi:hypothetical protein